MEIFEKKFKAIPYSGVTPESEEVFQVAPIFGLINYCLIYIFEFLPIIDRLRIERVCRHWHVVGKSSWRNVKDVNKDKKLWGFDISKESVSNQTNIIQQTLERCGRYIRQIDLTELRVQEKILYQIGALCPNLRCIDLDTIELTRPIAETIASNCRLITELAVGPCAEKCDDDYLSELLPKFKYLKHFRLYRNSNIDGKCLLSLPKDLQSIIIRENDNISLQYAVEAVNNLKKLHTVVLLYSWRDAEDEDSENDLDNQNGNLKISLHKCLKRLEMDMYLYELFDLKIILELSNIEILDLSSIDDVDDDFLFVLTENCKHISTLYLDGCGNISDIGVKMITELHRIQVLSIRQTKISDEPFKHATTLKELSCQRCPEMKDDGLCQLLESCKNIEMLDLKECPAITNQLVEKAARVCRSRPKNVSLSIELSSTSVKLAEIEGLPCNLKLITDSQKN